MILALILIVPLFIGAIFVFLKTTPESSGKTPVVAYNLGTIAIGVLGSVLFALKIRSSMIHGSDSAWWPYLAAIFSPVVLIGIVFVSGMIRNFVVFRRS